MIKAFRKHAYFTLFLAVYVLLALINLDRLPVAWTDEVLNLDPATQFTQHGQYFSKLWPNPGSEIHFASYLPGIQWFQTLYLFIVPFEIYWIRLPFLLLTIASIFLVYKILLQNKSIDPFTATLLVILIFLDKATFELSRSMRVEVLILFGTSCLFYLSKTRKDILFKSFIFGYLLMCHAYLWPFLGIWFLMDWMKLKRPLKFISAALFLIPTFGFMASFDFDIHQIIDQMGFHIGQHTIDKTDLPHHPILNSLWYRFYPFYLEQPFHPIIFYSIVFALFYVAFKRKFKYLFQNGSLMGWIPSLLILLFVLTPQYRYLPFFWLSGILIMSQIPQFNFSSLGIKILLIIITFNNGISFLGRHAAAILQQQSRNPVAVQDFLRNKLEDPKTSKKHLILGESIGFYFVNQKSNQQHFEYGIDFYPQHFNWNDYEKVYLLSHEIRPQDSLLGIYRAPKEIFATPRLMWRFAKGGTYDQMRIYILKH